MVRNMQARRKEMAVVRAKMRYKLKKAKQLKK
jgi:hypothetical protein